MDRSRSIRRAWKWVPLYALAVPGLAYFFINNYLPMEGLVIAFKSYTAKAGIWGSPWIGLKNFEFLFVSKEAWTITRNTLGYNLAFILVNTVLGIALAIFLNEIRKKSLRKVYQTMILLPYLMSMVVVGYLVTAFLGENTGIVNGILQTLMAFSTMSPDATAQFNKLVSLAAVTNIIPYVTSLSGLLIIMYKAHAEASVYRRNAAVLIIAMLYCFYALYASGEDAVFGAMIVMAVGYLLYGFIAYRFDDRDSTRAA